MKYLIIWTLATIVVVNAQFRFRPFSNFGGFRLPSFRRPTSTRPRAPRVINRPAPRPQTFTRRPPPPPPSFSTNVVSRPISTPITTSSISSSSNGNAIFEISGPRQPAAATPSFSSSPIRAPVVQSAPATALREIPSPDMTASAPSGGSSNSGANHQWQGRNYLITWREGRNGFSHSAARSYCRGRGMRIVSLDSIQKAQHFLDLVESDGAPYFWAGGQISS